MKKSVLLETSARHAHLSRRVLDILFGEGYELTHKKDLSQPGQFATNERIQVIGPKGSFPSVSILGRSARKPRSSSLLRTPVLSA